MCDTKSSSRQKKLMDLDICEKSVKQMKESGVTSVLLHTIGDPLANAKLKDYLKILRKYNLQAGLSTNALLLDKHVETLKEYFDIWYIFLHIASLLDTITNILLPFCYFSQHMHETCSINLVLAASCA